jgi:hypothetical protein
MRPSVKKRTKVKIARMKLKLGERKIRGEKNPRQKLSRKPRKENNLFNNVTN